MAQRRLQCFLSDSHPATFLRALPQTELNCGASELPSRVTHMPDYPDENVKPRVNPALVNALESAAHGDPQPLDALLPLVYDELRALARQHMNQEAAGHTLQA